MTPKERKEKAYEEYEKITDSKYVELQKIEIQFWKKFKKKLQEINEESN